MKKLSLLTVLALLVASAAMAQPISPSPLLGPTSLSNQDSCDIAVVPAATLLLPYFEVNLADQFDEDTLVTITNVSDVPTVAHVTVWTNYSFPVLDFNIFLTGYDVQSFSLFDVLSRGDIPDTSSSTSFSPRGTRSLSTNPNATFPSCGTNQGQGGIPQQLLASIQSALTGGGYAFGGCAAGTVSEPVDSGNAAGYITIDVAADCTQELPIETSYFNNTIRFDNQLIGDYIRIENNDNFAGATPLVHIRAIPPGGPSAGTTTLATTMPWTFYSRYQPILTPTRDRRQPLPSVFAGRYIEAGLFDTNFAIWREGVTGSTFTCSSYRNFNSDMPFVETVRFDERENPQVSQGGCTVSPCGSTDGLPEARLVNINDSPLAPDPSTDVAGWMYFNLSIPEGDALSPGRPTQAWVAIQMSAAGRFAVDFDAAYLANGCTGFVGATDLGSSITGNKIGPKYFQNLWFANQ